MNAAQKLVDAVKQQTDSHEFPPPADDATIAATELRLGITVPSDMAAFFRIMDGAYEWTAPDNGWMRLWELATWKRLGDVDSVRSCPLYVGLEDAIVCADYAHESWWYAFQPSRSTDGSDFILIDGLHVAKIVANTFTSFVNASLAGSDDAFPSL